MNLSDIQSILRKGVATASRSELLKAEKNAIEASCSYTLNEEKHTGCYLLSLLCLLEESYWVDGRTYYFNINEDIYSLEVSNVIS